MRSKLLQQVSPVAGIDNQVVTLSSGAATLKGNAIAHVDDNGTLGNTRSAVICINAGVSGAAAFAFTPKIQESDTTTDGDFTDVTLSGTLPVTASTTSAKSFKYFFLKTAGLKKYFRVVLTAAGTTTDTCSVSASVILGDGSIESLPRGTVPTVYAKA
jgi:hypothetical protein